MASAKLAAVAAGGLLLAGAPAPAAGDAAVPATAAAPVTAAVPTTAAAPTPSDEAFGDFGELDLGQLLDTEVVSASKRSERISDAPAVIEVVTADQIRAWGASSLSEALQHIAGIEVVENYFGYTNINMRGIQQPLYNNQVLLLIDGTPVFEGANGSFHAEQVPINAVERIEVIRGPGAVLYGTNAFAGVISVITREPETHEARGHLQMGDDLSVDARADGTGVWDGGYARLSVQALKTQRWTARVPADEAGDPARYPRGETAVAALFQAGQELGANHRVSLRGGYMDHRKRKWGLLPDADIDPRPNRINAYYADLGWTWAPDPVEMEAHATVMRNWRYAKLGPFPAPEEPNESFAGRADKRHALDVDTTSYRGALQAGYDGGWFTLLGGAEQIVHTFAEYNLEFASDGARSPLQQGIDTSAKAMDTNAFVQGAVFPVTDLTLGAGVRYNRFGADQADPAQPPPDPKHSLNPKASVVYRINEAATAKLLYGRGYRVPSLFELYANVPAVVIGSADLEPEIIDTFEAAVDLRPVDRMSLRVNGFVNLTRNTLRRVITGATASAYVNADGIQVRGVELTWRYLPHRMVDLYAAAGYQEGFAQPPGGGDYSIYLDDIARITLNASVGLRPLDGALEITPLMQYIGPRAGLGGVVLWHATAYWNPTDWLYAGVVGRNLFNRRYATPELQRGATPGGIVLNEPLRVQGVVGARFIP